MEASIIFGLIGAAAACFGVIFGVLNHLKYRRERESKLCSDEYLRGAADGTLKSDITTIKANSYETLQELRKFKIEQEKTNKSFDNRLTKIETRFQDHIDLMHKKESL